MPSNEQDKRSELESLEGAERLEKAVALHIHAINTPIMIIEGYLPGKPGEIMNEKALEKIQRSLDKVKGITQDLKAELVHYRTKKDS